MKSEKLSSRQMAVAVLTGGLSAGAAAAEELNPLRHCRKQFEIQNHILCCCA